MVLAYQSKEFGFGMNLTENELSEDNQYQMGKEYAGKDAATEYLGSPLKNKPLESSPFTRIFEYIGKVKKRLGVQPNDGSNGGCY